MRRQVSVVSASLQTIVDKLGAKNEGAGKTGSCILACLPQAAKDKLEMNVLGSACTSLEPAAARVQCNAARSPAALAHG